MSYPSPASTSDKIKVDSFAFRNTGVCWLVKKDGQPVNLCTKTLSVGDMVVFPRPRWRGTDRMDLLLVWYPSAKEGLAHRNGSLTGYLCQPAISPSIVALPLSPEKMQTNRWYVLRILNALQTPTRASMYHWISNVPLRMKCIELIS